MDSIARYGLAMKLLVLGATGRTGGQLVAQALDQGHEVQVVARDPGKVTAGDRVSAVAGSATDPDVLEQAVNGQEAVLCALGPRSPTALLHCELMRSSMRALIPAMERHGASRLVLLSALGAGASAGTAPLPLRLAFQTLLRAVGQDKSDAEDYVRASGVDWTIVYPPVLTNGPRTGSYRHGETLEVNGMPRISRADLAEFMLAQVPAPTYSRKSAVLSS